MYPKKRRSDRIQVAFPVRVRGMSNANKFFDEETETRFLSKHGIMTRLRNLVDLETEVHVTNLKNAVAGTFRAVWVNTRARENYHDIGLELVDAEGDMWGIHFPPEEPPPDETIARVWLECGRCHDKALTTVPEAEYEYLSEGFLIARHCDRCRATTSWEFAVQVEIVAEEGSKPKIRKPKQDDLRVKGRAPIKMQIKVTRRVYGTPIEDICETENVSRNGARFLSSQNYDVGENVEVVMPYKAGDVAIAAPARVVRMENLKGTGRRAVAIEIRNER
jgi:PilZ domain